MFQDQNNVEWFHFLPNKPVLSFFLSSEHVFRKRSRRIQRTNTKVKSPNNAMVNRLTCDSLSLWREVFLSVVEALHCSGCFSACRSAHFPVCEEDHGTGLALRLALLGCQGFCGILPSGPTSLHLGSSLYVRA